MNGSSSSKNRRVLIASSHGLFAQGLRSLLRERHASGVIVVGVVTNLEEALLALENLNPDLIIVDYDDQALNRDEFLARFVEGEKKLRVVLLSLQSGENAIVYDRRTLAASRIDDWLDEWNYSDEVKLPIADRRETHEKHRRPIMKYVHYVIVAILVVVIAVLLSLVLTPYNLLPNAASAQAVPIDSLFSLEFKFISFLFSLIIVFMVYSIVVFRRKRGDTTDAANITGSTRLEVLWTAAPLATVLFLGYLGGQSLRETMRADPKPLRVKVIGQQWQWSFEYPDILDSAGAPVVSAELRLPVNKQAVLLLSSLDVIHSFWVPEFRVKQDALPGDKFVRQLRVTPTKVGPYTLRCAELCGLNHTGMEAPVIVATEQEFNDWINQMTGVSNDPVVRGEKVYKTKCIGCHTLDGSPGVGPSWKGLYQSQVKLTDGSTVAADDAYLRNSILNTNSQIVQGFQPNLMPQNFSVQLSDQQISDVIEFIKTVK